MFPVVSVLPESARHEGCLAIQVLFSLRDPIDSPEELAQALSTPDTGAYPGILLEHSTASARLGVARDHATAPHVLQLLALDDDWDVAYAALENPRTPAVALHSLYLGGCAVCVDARARLAATTTRDDYVNILRGDDYVEVAQALGHNPAAATVAEPNPAEGLRRDAWALDVPVAIEKCRRWVSAPSGA